MTTRALAQRLGRSWQSLYYHLDLLERGGLVVAEQPVDGGRERCFRLRARRLAAGAARGSKRDRAAAARAIGALLRLTAREVSVALTDPAPGPEGASSEPMALRGKARLTVAALERARQLVGELEALFRTGGRSSRGRPLYALTLVLTPAREAGDSDSAGGNSG